MHWHYLRADATTDKTVAEIIEFRLLHLRNEAERMPLAHRTWFGLHAASHVIIIRNETAPFVHVIASFFLHKINFNPATAAISVH